MTLTLDKMSRLVVPKGSAADYQAVMAETVNQHRSSGAIHDALHIIGARNAQCKKLPTLNLKHFNGLAPADAMIVSP